MSFIHINITNSKKSNEQMGRIELPSSDWKSEVMTIIRHLPLVDQPGLEPGTYAL